MCLYPPQSLSHLHLCHLAHRAGLMRHLGCRVRGDRREQTRRGRTLVSNSPIRIGLPGCCGPCSALQVPGLFPSDQSLHCLHYVKVIALRSSLLNAENVSSLDRDLVFSIPCPTHWHALASFSSYFSRKPALLNKNVQ